jgi:hypothetical protein
MIRLGSFVVQRDWDHHRGTVVALDDKVSVRWHHWPDDLIDYVDYARLRLAPGAPE